jgi:peptidoglycan/LPS O-acetylase OafA/YrhL
MNRQFAALRGIAMIVVVLHHAIDLTFQAMERADYAPLAGALDYVVSLFYHLGIFAVPLFLFISGAFMAYAARGNPPTLGWKVVSNGLQRMIWPYLLWSGLFYVLVYLHYGQSFSPLGYVKNLLTGYPFHFVPLLIFFYVLSPFMVWFVTRYKLRYSLLLLLALAVYQVVLLNLRVPITLGFRFPEWMQLLYAPVLGATLAQWAIYFPLGLVYGLHAKQINPVLQKGRWGILALLIVLFGLGYAFEVGWLRVPVVPLAIFFASVPLLLYTPLISRSSIPQVKTFEQVGKRSYGLYLMHLIAIDLTLVVVEWLLPGLVGLPVLLILLLFAAGVLLPMVIMEKAAQLKGGRTFYQYVFG